MGLENLTSLCRVSKQLHNETSSIVWKTNDFLFQEDSVGLSLFGHFRDGATYAYSFFFRRAGRNISQNVRKITLETFATSKFRVATSLLDNILAVVKLPPGVQLRIHNNIWKVVDTEAVNTSSTSKASLGSCRSAKHSRCRCERGMEHVRTDTGGSFLLW